MDNIETIANEIVKEVKEKIGLIGVFIGPDKQERIQRIVANRLSLENNWTKSGRG